MIDLLTQVYGLCDRKIMLDMTSWLENTWDFELGLLQISDLTDPEAYYPLSFPICDPSFPNTQSLTTI